MRRPRDIPTRRAAERFAQGAGENVHLVDQIEILVRASAMFTEHARAMRIIDDQHRLMLTAKWHQTIKPGGVAFHAEHAIGHHPARGLVRMRRQLFAQIIHVLVLVNRALDFFARQPRRINDARVVQCIRQNHILLARHRRQQRFVGIPTAHIRQRRFLAHELQSTARSCDDSRTYRR